MNAFVKMIHSPKPTAQPVHTQFTCFEYDPSRIAVNAQYAELEVVHVTNTYGRAGTATAMAFTKIKQVFQRLSDDKLIDVSIVYFLDSVLEQDLKTAIQAAAMQFAESQVHREVVPCN